LTPDDCRDKVVILDEADYGFDNFAATFDSDGLPLGLISLKYAKQIFFMSATYDRFHEEVLRRCFDCPLAFLMKFKGVH
jgi:hypothetical protein